MPGSSKKFLEKSRGLNVDCVAYDLEDSVTPGRKAEARRNLRHFLEQPRSAGIREQAVRINAVESGLALDDLTEVVFAFQMGWLWTVNADMGSYKRRIWTQS